MENKNGLMETVDLMCSDEWQDRLKAEFYQADERLKRLIKCLAKREQDINHEYLLSFLPKLAEYRNACKESLEINNIKY